MKFLNFQCTEYFKTSGSACFDLRETVSSVAKPVELQDARLVSSVGYLEIHYPAAGHIKTYVRVVLSSNLAKNINRMEFKDSVEIFLEKQGLPSGVTYEADLIPYNVIMRVENRVDVEGKTDGLS